VLSGRALARPSASDSDSDSVSDSDSDSASASASVSDSASVSVSVSVSDSVSVSGSASASDSATRRRARADVTAPRRRANLSGMPRSPTVAQLAAQVAALAAKLDRLSEAPAAPRPRTRQAAPAAPGGELLPLIERRNPPAKRKPGRRSGAVVYGGAVTPASGGEYLWLVERATDDVMAVDADRAAAVLAALGSGPRLRLILAILDRPRTAAELRGVLGSRSPGPVYHHLRDLVALGLIAQRERRYVVPPRQVVPLLTALCLAIDLATPA
jgi:DNA-binding transcriptional ArsR family regulator